MSFLATSSLLLPATSFANIANSTQNQSKVPTVPKLTAKQRYGCQAFLCFAGGMHTPECQSTISKVTRDLARGRSFPTCPMIANSDGSIGGQNGSQKIWTTSTRKRVYVYVQEPDGTVRQVSNIRKRR